MSRRKSLSDIGVAALKPRAARYAEPDPELRGHYVRVQPGGSKTFVTVARDPNGKQVWTTIGAADVLSIDVARTQARSVIERIRKGLPAFEAPEAAPDTFKDVADNWLKRHVSANGVRSEKKIRSILDAYVLPAWADREFLAIRRSDVAALLDAMVDNCTAIQADRVLIIVRAICNWYATRHDAYQPPFVKGMRRSDPKAAQRDRILNDDELRTIWRAAEEGGTFGALVRLALLTAQRSRKIVEMKWADIDGNGIWTIPKSAREKGTAGTLALPRMAVDIIEAQPRFAANDHVLVGPHCAGGFNNFSNSKTDFDAKLPPMPRWTLHDLRRTARSLMARAGVRPDIAERVLGHAIAGVEGVYNRHDYNNEKAHALQRLAMLIGNIVDPQANVTPMRKRRAG